MADALVSTVLMQLFSVGQQEVTLVAGVTKEVEQLSSTFRKIQAVLKDAEEKQVKDESVKLWLEDLKDVAYDMDDVLDEWRTRILMRAQAQGVDDAGVSMRKKVCTPNLFSSCFCFKQLGLCQRHDIGSKLKKIKERLDKIAIEKDRYHFIQSTNTEREKGELERSQTSSQVDQSEIFGRDLDKDVIINKLMSEQEMDPAVPIISIIGMGGLGKTTLAQLVYNDARVESHFKKRVWVCVSKPFDKVKIAKQIIKCIHEKVVDGDDTTWGSLHHQLSESVEGKHFLLVLDDMWTEDYTKWEPLRLSLNRGARGSRIVVTTRNEGVVLMMGATYIHSLGKLSKQDCWSLLSHIAFVGRGEEECAKLKEIGMKIVKKCKGLPLSVKTIGSLLRIKRTKQDWRDVLESDTWNLPEVGKGVLPALLLSYNDLPSHLKRCFTYCAIFPKRDEIEKDILIKMWMAQGFLNSSFMEEMRDLDLIGREYFDNLVMRSFFQKCEDARKCKMHDLVHDFAHFIMKNECFIMEIEGEAQEFNWSNARHLTLIWNNKDMNSLPSSIYKAKKLRTLQILVPWPQPIVVHPFELFHHLTCLRALDLSFTKLEELPSEVENLTHLRYLDLSNTSLTELPETVSNLYNLQTLKLEECSNLCKLPTGLWKLLNLRHLMLFYTVNLNYLPQGIGRLRTLRTLSKFVVGGGSEEGRGCKIGELKDLKLLTGVIRIRGLAKVANGNEANEAELKSKQHLRGLALYFDENDGGNTEAERMESVLEGLQPHPNIEILKIHDYLGTKLPNWMVRSGDLVLSNLLCLRLHRCGKCKQLPPTFGELPNLEELELGGMEEVKYIGSEFFGVVGGGGNTSDGEVKRIFPKLKKLKIVQMCNLEELDLGIEEVNGKKNVFMPCLHCLVLGHCHKLKALPRHISASILLRQLDICDCPKLTWTPPSCLLLPHLEELFLNGDAGELSRSLAPNNHICFSNLLSLHIWNSKYSSLPKGFAQLIVLQFLGIDSCNSFTSLPEELQHLTTLRDLVIYDCPALVARCQKEVGEDWSKISHIPNIDCL